MQSGGPAVRQGRGCLPVGHAKHSQNELSGEYFSLPAVSQMAKCTFFHSFRTCGGGGGNRINYRRPVGSARQRRSPFIWPPSCLQLAHRCARWMVHVGVADVGPGRGGAPRAVSSTEPRLAAPCGLTNETPMVGSLASNWPYTNWCIRAVLPTPLWPITTTLRSLWFEVAFGCRRGRRWGGGMVLGVSS